MVVENWIYISRIAIPSNQYIQFSIYLSVRVIINTCSLVFCLPLVTGFSVHFIFNRELVVRNQSGPDARPIYPHPTHT